MWAGALGTKSAGEEIAVLFFARGGFFGLGGGVVGDPFWLGGVSLRKF